MTPPVAAQRPTDVIVMMTDQHRADLCRREGFAVDTTPTLDRLARSGTWFDHAYTSAPLCVPARISLLTGRFPSAHGVRENYDYHDPRCTDDLMSMAAAAGYRTALIGKNHSHLTADRVDHLVEFGHLGRVSSSGGSPDHLNDSAASATARDHDHRELDDWLKRHPGTTTTPTPFPAADQIPFRLVDETVDWLERHAELPTFTWLSFPEPHVPYQVPEPYFSAFGPDVVPPPATGRADLESRGTAWRYTAALADRAGEGSPEVLRRARANYAGMLRLVDDAVARLVSYLEHSGRLATTLLVFVSDHGDFAGEYGLMRKGPGVPEVLTRVPMFVTGPGVTARPEPHDAHVSIVDVLPTLCELLGRPLPTGAQGRSLVPLLRGEEYPAAEFDSVLVEQGVGGLAATEDIARGWPGVRRTASGGTAVDTLNEVTQTGTVRAVRAGRWKVQADGDGDVQLFDLVDDPYELTDRADDPACAAVLTMMLRRLASWLVRAADPLPVPGNGYRRVTHPRNYQWFDDTPAGTDEPARPAGHRSASRD